MEKVNYFVSDLKPTNIVIMKKLDKLYIKIIDFGPSKQFKNIKTLSPYYFFSPKRKKKSWNTKMINNKLERLKIDGY